ncbi:MAG TPA: GlxA family transcriptional regulator [Caulobacteraceae bacterium]|jgi:transcriptional regulator GlxA family with amidase domain|nr:GlxA family transcriptional regulator [Caulobacteraceae bacterium]
MTPPRILGLLLIDGFALMSYASIVEPYRAANVLAGEELYRWVHVSIDGRPVRASNGAGIAADLAVGRPLACDTLFVFAAGDPASFRDAATFAWLRGLARRGATLAGVSGGPFLLANAGLLDGHRATIHWDHRPAFAEAFDEIAIEPSLYVIDRRRVTCAGGASGLDLAIELIEREQGHALASRVGDWFIHTEARAADQPQRASLRERYGVANDRVLKVLSRMEASVEEPETRAALARIAGVSLRQLERLFVAHVGESVNDCYRRIRLDQAAQLLRKTGQSATSVAIACGFRSSSHFSRAYKARYGVSPARDRRQTA